jgi:NAD(P)-dependent dehydrogenase (short-subunit alcohol dehydrogenase family)
LLTEGGTVVNVTSDASVEHYDGWGAYGATKAAIDLLTGVLGVETPHVRFYALDPGDMRTAMHQAAFPGEDISDRAAPEDRAPALLKLLNGDLPSGRYRADELL